MGDDRPPTVVVQPSQGVIGVAADTVGALRGSPTLLVMVVLNCVFIAGAAYYLRNQQDHAFKLVGAVLERCLPEPHAAPPARPNSAPPPNEHQG
jgi:hypothetical protein